ncbi:ATP-dependent Clp protease ATP-binding subunit [Phaeodactylibacter luteus]|uniref:ATP-dependent Clp protease ATP-binding subunit n=2 Tax=Phaeodactylibacter luteus TaxID=1564516 RepID=A0A5C6S9B6_9BACT|nr:ATP-dependent Clp protease ATP-binding subunit [Phaeodactylibacter luteus]
MEKITYPLLIYPLKEDALLGVLAGTDIQAVEPNVQALKKSLRSYLQKQYKKYDEYPAANMTAPKLKMVSMQVRPAYRDRHGVYPMPDSLQIELPVVFGQVPDGHYECHLPYFQESIFYYDPSQFDALVQHAATTWLNNMKPEEIYQLLRYPKPDLDIITLRVNKDRSYFWGGWNFENNYETLSRLAEAYPPSKSKGRGGQSMPEAVWERESEIAEVISKILNTRSNLIVAGPPGTGKSAVLRQAIKRISSRSRKQQLGLTFWKMMPQRITASSKYLGEWEEKAEQLVEELNAANGIIWVENLVQLLEAGGEGPEDSVAAFLMAFLEQGKLQMIGEATPQELESMRRFLPGFAEAFQVVNLPELSEQRIQRIQAELSQFAAQQLKINITADAQQLAYRLLVRYYPYESFPGKLIRFVSQCIQEARAKAQQEIRTSLVTDVFVRQTGLPELFLRDELPLDTAALSAYFGERIIGQPAAVEALSNIVKIYKAGLNNPHRPIASFLFAGPTGVGKTASAKALAEYFFGKGQRQSPLIRIDMSEFQYPEQIVRLIGAGREVGQLVKEVRERPFSVLLLDEVEKADPSIFDALMGLLDEGFMVDAYGRLTSFRNTIIIMTSNLGANNRTAPGFGGGMPEPATYRSAIERYFRPEFVNRIDELVIFRSLEESDIYQITLKELEELRSREGFVKSGLEVHFSEALVRQLASVGFDARYGARPLQRAIEDYVVMPVARWLLQNTIPGQGQLHLDVDANRRLSLKYTAS